MDSFAHQPNRMYPFRLELSTRQLDLWQAIASGRYQFIAYGGAIRGGKTIGSLACIVALCKVFPGSRWALVRNTYRSLLQTSLPSLLKVVPPRFIARKPTAANNYTLHFTNGSQILLFAECFDTDKDLDRWKGLEVNGFVLEQAEELQWVTVQKAFERAGTWILPNKQPKPLVIATLNPSHKWPYEKLYKPWKRGLLPENWCYLPAFVTDNPHLPEGFLEHLKASMEPMHFARFVQGDWEAQRAEKPFAFAFDEAKHVSDAAVYRPDQPVYISFDFNVNPGCCIVAQHGYANGQTYLHVIDELRLPDTDLYAMSAILRERYGRSVLLLTGDASGNARSVLTRGAQSAYQILLRELNVGYMSLRVPTKNPPLLPSRSLLNRILGIHPGLAIHPQCTHLLNDLRYVEADEQGKPRKDNGDLTHLLDAFRYYLHTFHAEWALPAAGLFGGEGE